MRKFTTFASVVALAFVFTGSAAIADDDNKSVKAPDDYLSDTAVVSKNFGPAALDSQVDLNKKGVGFALSGLTGSGTGISDNFPLDARTECTDSIFAGIISDCTAFKKFTLKIKNLGTVAVNVAAYLNTGFTAGGGLSAGCVAANLACDTFWQGAWVEIKPGKTKKVKIDFDNATPFNCGDEPDFLGCVDGTAQAIFRLDEVTNLGFQVADFAGGPTSTWLKVVGKKADNDNDDNDDKDDKDD